MVTEYTELDIEIEPGMDDNHELVFQGEGEPHMDGSCLSIVKFVSLCRVFESHRQATPGT
jgi:DnaJ-class molecular chaperone